MGGFLMGEQLKVFKYSFPVTWGQGCGIVVAKNKERAQELIKDIEESLGNSYNENILLEELILVQEGVTSFSWEI